MSPEEFMEPCTVMVRLRDGGSHTLIADYGKALELNLENALVHPFTASDGSVILYILEDGEGNEFRTEKDNVGISAPHYITKQKNRFGQREMFDLRQSQLLPVKDRRHLVD